MKTDTASPHRDFPGRTLLLAAAIGMGGLLLGACGQSASGPDGAATDATTRAAKVASSAHFDKDINKRPCEIIGKAAVASAFGVPAADIKQSSFSRICRYEWEGGNEELNVEVYVRDVRDNAKFAAAAFESSTRSMSAEEVAAAMAKVRAQLDKDGAVQTESQKKAAGKVTGLLGRDGFTYEDVAGVADQARFDVRSGELIVRLGNVSFKVNAYKGPPMPRPDKVTADSIMASHKAWMADTLEARKQAAVKLTQTAVEML